MEGNAGDGPGQGSIPCICGNRKDPFQWFCFKCFARLPMFLLYQLLDQRIEKRTDALFKCEKEIKFWKARGGQKRLFPAT